VTFHVLAFGSPPFPMESAIVLERVPPAMETHQYPSHSHISTEPHRRAPPPPHAAAGVVMVQQPLPPASLGAPDRMQDEWVQPIIITDSATVGGPAGGFAGLETMEMEDGQQSVGDRGEPARKPPQNVRHAKIIFWVSALGTMPTFTYMIGNDSHGAQYGTPTTRGPQDFGSLHVVSVS